MKLKTLADKKIRRKDCSTNNLLPCGGEMDKRLALLLLLVLFALLPACGGGGGGVVAEL